MYKPVQLDAQGRAVWLGVQGKAEQQLGGAEQLCGAEQRLGGAGEAAELCGAAELLGAQGKVEQRLGGAERLLGGAGEAAWRSGRGGGALWSGRAFGCSPYMPISMPLPLLALQPPTSSGAMIGSLPTQPDPDGSMLTPSTTPIAMRYLQVVLTLPNSTDAGTLEEQHGSMTRPSVTSAMKKPRQASNTVSQSSLALGKC